MSEALAAFQAQLSGLMETVFKAAMYEIVRLVEDSFVEEVSRSREQVEALRKRLQWAEGRRREAERCAQCGKAAVWGPEHGGPEGGRGLKQEGGAEGRWSSCPKGEEEEKEQEEEGGLAAAKAPEEASGPGALHAPEQPALVEGEKPVPLKREQVPPRSSQEPQRWSVSADGEEADVSAPDGAFGEEMQPPSVDGWASSASLEGRGSLRGHVAESTEQYRTRFSQEGLVGLEDALETEPKAPFVCQVFDGEALRGHGLEEPQSVQLHYDAPGLLHTELGAVDDQAITHLSFQRNRVTAFGERFRSRSASPRGDVDIGELSYLLINEDGYLQETDDSYWGQPGVESVSGEGQLGQRVRGEEFVSPHRDADGRSESLDISSPGHCGERARSCSQCHVSFADLGALKVHMSSHRAPSTYTCTQCGKSFTQACNLKVHQRIHSREGLHLCSHCGKGFVSFADLKKHKCSHTGDKPYCCMLCGNKFSRLWNLKLHRRIHTQEKPHRCTQCEKSFTRADILKVHQRTHTGERPYCCTMCGLSFKRLDHLKSHQRKHRPQQS